MASRPLWMIPPIGMGLSLLVWWAVSPPELPPLNNTASSFAGGRTAQTAVYSPPIRVKLTPKNVRQLKIAIDGPYRIRPMGSPQVLSQGPRLKKTTAVATSRGFRIGKNEFRVSQLEIEAVDSPAIWVGKHQYRGNLRLYRRPRNKFGYCFSARAME